MVFALTKILKLLIMVITKKLLCTNKKHPDMRIHFLAALAALTPLFFPSPAKAANPSHIEQLMNTRACVGCNLSGADLSQTHLIGVDLRDANLEGANLTEANLEGADLTGADLEGANLTAAFLTNAVFKQADLDEVNLRNAIIYDANVSGASMEDMNLTGAQIFNTGIGIGGEAPN